MGAGPCVPSYFIPATWTESQPSVRQAWETGQRVPGFRALCRLQGETGFLCRGGHTGRALGQVSEWNSASLPWPEALGDAAPAGQSPVNSSLDKVTCTVAFKGAKRAAHQEVRLGPGVGHPQSQEPPAAWLWAPAQGPSRQDFCHAWVRHGAKALRCVSSLDPATALEGRDTQHVTGPGPQSE